MKKILLTGASGFLGNYILEFLRKNNYQVDTLGRDSGSSIIADLTNISPRFEKKYDLVVHCAGLAHVIPRTDKQEYLFFDLNLKGTENLCRGLEENPPNTFIFISTIAVYGKESGQNIVETDVLNGHTPYAKSKILAEKFLSNWSTTSDVNLVILRLPLIAGKCPKGNLKSMISSIKKGFYFNIKNNESRKSIVRADDVAELIPRLDNQNGVYHLSCDQSYTFEEISTMIAENLRIKKVKRISHTSVKILALLGDFIPFSPINSSKLNKIKNTLTISSEKAKKELGWKPRPLDKNILV